MEFKAIACVTAVFAKLHKFFVECITFFFYPIHELLNMAFESLLVCGTWTDLDRTKRHGNLLLFWLLHSLGFLKTEAIFKKRYKKLVFISSLLFIFVF